MLSNHDFVQVAMLGKLLHIKYDPVHTLQMTLQALHVIYDESTNAEALLKVPGVEDRFDRHLNYFGPD